MCGICGSTNDRDQAGARAMNTCLRHRGPDDSGVYGDLGSGASLGATRLSIIDVEGGHQPVANEDGTVHAVLNGEIYNHPQLQDQLRQRGHRLHAAVDTEVLVHLYEDHGDDLVDHLDGMYAFAVWDAERRRLLLGRDRFGEKPLFYAERDGSLLFASELSALAAVLSVEIDPVAVDAYFVLGYVPAPMTMFAGVRQLEPGHVLTWTSAHGAKERSYWQPPTARESGVAPESAVAETERLFEASVRSRLIADVPVGVFLSGGLDSTLVATFASRASGHRLQTFTVGYDVGDVNETDAARDVANELGTDHHELHLTEADIEPLARDLLGRLDQPNADQALLASFAVSRFARQRVKVALGGEGADELFGGYPRYRWLARAATIDRVVPSVVRRAAWHATAAAPVHGRAQRLRQLIDPGGTARRHLDWVTDGRLDGRARLYGPRLQASYSAEAVSARLGSSGDTARDLMLLDQRLWLPDDVLAKADRASMLASLEVRTPFLEPTLAAHAASVSTKDHLVDGGKALLRAVLKRQVGHDRLLRRKTAYRVPAADWLRGPLASLLREQLADGPLLEAGYFDAAAVRSMASAHSARSADHTAVLWPILVLSCWAGRQG